MKTYKADIIIIGGGIAGIWTLAHLRALGFNAILLEKNTIGCGQSVQSQGIIHGGAKYALNGIFNRAAQAVAEMPNIWLDALAGKGNIDLSETELLSNHHYLVSSGGFASSITAKVGSMVVKNKGGEKKGSDRPQAFQDKKFKGKVYALNEPVFNLPQVFATLQKQYAKYCFAIDAEELNFNSDDSGTITSINYPKADLNFEAKAVIFSAGEGNEKLLEKWQTPTTIEKPDMQRRPLHMTLVKHSYPHPVYAHFLGAGEKPDLTITSHPHSDGSWVWCLGGNLSESAGVARDPEAQIAEAKKLTERLVPWIDLEDAQWATYRINRAEPQQKTLIKPDHAFTSHAGNVICAWPTKLALAPDLAERVENILKKDMHINPSQEDFSAGDDLPMAQAAPGLWEELFSC